jgi:hypothetical protein
LEWVNAAGTDTKTIIRRNVTTYPSLSSGIEIYNGTDTTYTDTTGGGSTQYYRAWIWGGDKISDNSTNATATVPPCPATSVSTTVLANNSFDITWTKGVGAITTVIVRKLGSFPTSVTDGTAIYNDTGTSKNSAWIEDNYFYALYSYANTTYSTQVNLTIGGLIANCYDEITNEPLEFDISIFNQDGTQLYESFNNTNPHILNVSQLPLGNQIRFVFTASQNYTDKTEVFTGYPLDENFTITYVVLQYIPRSKSSTNVTTTNTSSGTDYYPPFTIVDDVITILPDASPEFDEITVSYEFSEYASRSYYRDLNENSFYLLNAYLPPSDEKVLYTLQVVDQDTQPVEDAFIEIKRIVNESFVIISSVYTDSSGIADVFLITDTTYLFIISKDGYETINASWIPGEVTIKQFKLNIEIDEVDITTIGDVIKLVGTLYENNTLKVTFYDKLAETINTHFYIYEYYNDTYTYIGEYNGTTDNSFNFWKYNLNVSRSFVIVLYINHTTLGFVGDYRVIVTPLHTDRDQGSWFENLLQGEVGEFDYGYVITFLWYLPAIILILGFGAMNQPGFAVLSSGLYSIFLTWWLELSEQEIILTFAGIAIVIGFITIILKQGKKVVH